MQTEDLEAGEEGLAHTIPVPPISDTTGALQKVAIPEPTLVDVILCDHQHTLALLDHFTLAAAQGNSHAMELLAGALALDLRLHLQAEADVLHPLLGTSLRGAGAALQPLKQMRQALEGDILEILTYRRERDWKRLAAVVQGAHQDFASHVQKEEFETLPLLVRDLSQAQLTELAGRYHHVKRTATLLPHVNIMPSVAHAAFGEAAMGEAAMMDAEDEVPKVSFPDSIELPETQPEV